MVSNLQNQDIALVITTECNYENAEKLAEILVTKKLAKCVSFSEINSIYCWNNQIIKEKEIQLNIKVESKLVDKLYCALKEIHSYKLPQFICLKASASDEYYKWCIEKN